MRDEPIRPGTTAQIGCELNGTVGDSGGDLEEFRGRSDLAGAAPRNTPDDTRAHPRARASHLGMAADPRPDERLRRSRRLRASVGATSVLPRHAGRCAPADMSWVKCSRAGREYHISRRDIPVVTASSTMMSPTQLPRGDRLPRQPLGLGSASGDRGLGGGSDPREPGSSTLSWPRSQRTREPQPGVGGAVGGNAHHGDQHVAVSNFVASEQGRGIFLWMSDLAAPRVG
jgi:hypothetical protein